MKIRVKNRENRKEKQFYYIRLALFSFFFSLFSISIYAQDSIPAAKDLTEEKELDFQQYFFKALSEKSIGNYQRAIENLESCNQILLNDVAVFYEFSKNYLFLNKTLLAKEYINRALAKDSENIWMLKHLVKIYIRDKDFDEAIKEQQKIIQKNPKERSFLVRIYLQNRNYNEALSLMNTLEKENGLSASLKRVKTNLEKRKIRIPDNQKTEETDTTSLENQFKTDKTYIVLEKLLNKYKTDTNLLLKYSNEGISLFPAQPFVYLMNGKALNNQKSYKKALVSLKNGIDFVIDDEMEVDFYKEMAKASKALGNSKEEKKYLEKAKKLKS